MGDIRFNYYYGAEAEQFSFYRVPRLLVKDARFKGLTSDAKLLYGLMLDRMSLSIKNEWFDDQNRAYIIYTIENVIEDLGCGRDKAIKVLKELDEKTGIGLIEKVRQGLGKPDIIYVKNFCIVDETNLKKYNEKSDFQKSEKSTSKKGNIEDEKNLNSDISSRNNTKNAKSCMFMVKKGDLGNSRYLSEVGKTDFRESEISTSRGRKNLLPEVGKTASNHTDINNTDLNYTNQINLSRKMIGDSKETYTADEILAYRDLIRENIDLNRQTGEYTEEWMDYVYEVYELICDIVLVPRKSVTIDKIEYPYEVVRTRFLQLTGEHVDYVIDSIKHYKGKINNIKGFMITALYNAPTSCNLCRSQSITHAAYGGNE